MELVNTKQEFPDDDNTLKETATTDQNSIIADEAVDKDEEALARVSDANNDSVEMTVKPKRGEDPKNQFKKTLSATKNRLSETSQHSQFVSSNNGDKLNGKTMKIGNLLKFIKYHVVDFFFIIVG